MNPAEIARHSLNSAKTGAIRCHYRLCTTQSGQWNLAHILHWCSALLPHNNYLLANQSLVLAYIDLWVFHPYHSLYRLQIGILTKQSYKHIRPANCNVKITLCVRPGARRKDFEELGPRQGRHGNHAAKHWIWLQQTHVSMCAAFLLARALKKPMWVLQVSEWQAHDTRTHDEGGDIALVGSVACEMVEYSQCGMVQTIVSHNVVGQHVVGFVNEHPKENHRQYLAATYTRVFACVFFYLF